MDNPIVPLSNSRQLFRQHTQLPPELSNQEPRWSGNTVGRFIFDKVMPALRLGRVSSTELEHSGQTLYRIEVGVPLRKTVVHVTPVGAYYLGMLIMLASTQGHQANLVVRDDNGGGAYIPLWAFNPVMSELADICIKHHEHIKLVAQEIGRLAREERNQEQQEEEVLPASVTGLTSSNKPILH